MGGTMREAGTVSAVAGFLPLTIGESKMAQQILPESPSGIYEILNTVTDKRYVGSAQNFLKRWRIHTRLLKRGEHHSRHLQSAWNKHGPDVFVFQAILYCAPEELIEYEQLCIDEMNSAYNICRVAGSTKGTIKSIECRQKISAKAIGRVWTEEARAKVSATLKGRKMSEAFSDTLRGNQRAKGYKHTDEWKAANAERMRGRKRPKDAEYRRKISESLKGVPHSAERRAKQSEAQRGLKKGPYKPMSEATRAAALAKRRANPPKRVKREYSEEERKSLAERAKLAKLTPEGRIKKSESARAMWADPEKKAAILAKRAEAKKAKLAN